MQQEAFTLKRSKRTERQVAGAAGYSRYADQEIFPRLGGDEFDPPLYATDRRSASDAAQLATPAGTPAQGRLAQFARALASAARLAGKKFGASLPSLTLSR